MAIHKVESKQKPKPAARESLVKAIANQVADRNDEALKRLSKH